MNPFRERIKQQSARAYYNLCKRVGDCGTFSNRGETAVEIWFVPQKITRALHKGPSLQEEYVDREFAVPLQFACVNSEKVQTFPPVGGVVSGAQITYEGKTWTVELEGTAARENSIESIYFLATSTHVPRRANP